MLHLLAIDISYLIFASCTPRCSSTSLSFNFICSINLLLTLSSSGSRRPGSIRWGGSVRRLNRRREITQRGGNIPNLQRDLIRI
ncbi:hypothetical protein K438DRAFT_308698 [Mycena galopus ATCC 62051]|nr:hypothetical protein K438DRAFT_308698 [Mycena galopus ATCC 62051]